MMEARLLSAAILLSGALLLPTACVPPRRHAADTDTISGADTLNISPDLTLEAGCRADSILSRMTIDERIGQMIMPGIYCSSDEATLALLHEYAADMHLGGIILLKGSLREAAEIARMLRADAKVGMFVAIDAEWGLNMRFKDAPRFPPNGYLGEEADESLMYDYGYEMARECRLAGVNMLLGPVVDVVREGGGNPIGRRSFGSDPGRVASLAVAYARGVEDGNVISVAKHFPGHGAASGDSHRQLQRLDRSLDRLDSIDLYPFRRYINAGLSAVMVGHLAVPAIDPMRRPAAVSPVVMQDLLRGDLGFRGLVLTDAMNMGGAEDFTPVDAILAGADIVIAPKNTRKALDAIRRAVDDGTLSVDIINDRCRRILFHKILKGNNPDSVAEPDSIGKAVGSREASSLRQRLEMAATRH